MMFKLKNFMKHENYSFPESFVEYKTEDFDVGDKGLYLNDTEVPYQLSENNSTITFLTDLKCNSEKVFVVKGKKDVFLPNVAEVTDNSIAAESGKIKITVDKSSDSLFSVSGSGVRAVSYLDGVKGKKIELLENGPIFAKIKIAVVLDDGEYIQTLKVYKNSEYVILDEEINTSEKEMLLKWENVSPRMRATQCGETEGRIGENYFGADEYTDTDGKIVQRILPHDQTNGFINSIYCAFLEEKAGYGIFMGDIAKWDDGNYAIEGHNYINAVNAYCKYNGAECDLYFKYPLNKGSRQTCIAIYSGKKEKSSKLSTYIADLHFFYTKLPLNNFKDWVFDIECDKSNFPVYFDKSIVDENQKYDFGDWEKGIPDAKWMLNHIKENRIYIKPWFIGPVYSRAYAHWSAAFDLKADEMTDEIFDEYKNILIFGAYYCANENIMPIETTLAGHPNFLMDVYTIVGICSALFPNHPMAQKWKEKYERAVALVLKFHIRPEVKAWKSKGGRPTENHGTYLFGCLKHIFQAALMINKVYSDNPVLYENLEKLSEWLLNLVTAPIGGERALPYTGAHAGTHQYNPYYLLYYVRILGYMMMEYNPQLGEKLLNICPKTPVRAHETAFYGGRDIYDYAVFDSDYCDSNGVVPELKSSKFTGYGYNLRANVNCDDEMFVLLQQIDDGQNYRWGRAAQGGCGTIHYYADDKRFTGNRKEDIGDDNFADHMVGCNFCVLNEQTYKSVGRNDLINPLVDAEFLKYARVDAGQYSNSEYKYRSVMMIDNRYIVIYDAVRDIRTQGKFSWFNYVDEDMPYIYQLKPGAMPIGKNAPEYTIDDKPRAKSLENDKEVRGVSYNGYGDFLTVVTHKEDVKPVKTKFGAVVSDREYIFNSTTTNKVTENGISFLGKIGFLRRTKNGFEMCNIDAFYIGVDNIVLERVSGVGAISLKAVDTVYSGVADENVCIRLYGVDKKIKFYNNGKEKNFVSDDKFIELEISAGQFEITNRVPKPQKINSIKIAEHKNGIEISFEKIELSTHYEVAYGTSYDEFKVLAADSNYAIISADIGKYYVKARAVNHERNGEWSDVHTAYITKKPPKSVKGFRIKAQNNGLSFRWGMQHGALIYKLYKINTYGEKECIYEGSNNTYFLNDRIETEFYVICANGWGESEKSVIRSSSKEGLAYFDPYPEKSFVRDTIINHHGYGGFDYAYNEKRTILEYPD